ncbi:hypothetical protein VNI00_000474 [Paramarasmius palmivorus]|uniref:Protein-S-isoprenylcysteine O-methyltransferase n=1 Tax=Paramarasmius palmivorus TaxID=297713 RepID=A0AAW0EBL7_9AGAR
MPTQILAKALLVLLSAASFTVICTPPNGFPGSSGPRPSFKKGFSSEVREWILTFVPPHLFPLQKKLYWLASLNEVVHIFRSDSEHLSPLFIAAAASSISGGLIRYLCYRALTEAFTLDLVPVGTRSDKAAKLITNGPYSIVRHPSYTGVILNFVGSVAVHVVEGSWVRSTPSMLSILVFWVLGVPCVVIMLVCCISLVARTNEEDEMVHKQFGEEWENWKTRVRYKLVPGVY